MDLGLSGRIALVTGASRGIGFAVADRLAEAGCKLRLAARRPADLEAAAARLGEAVLSIHPADMREAASVTALGNVCGDVDILVNNAGATPTGPIEAATEADWREGLELKVIATVMLTKAIYGAMCARGHGVIVNVIGNCGERPDPDIIVATVTNTGMMGFTQALGAVSPTHGVRVLGVNPGPTATERLVSLMQRKTADRYGDADRWRELVAPLPFGRAAEPREIADMIAFAASDRASYVSGTILTVDGGVAKRGHLF